jgi:hypothetical protein
VAAHDVGDGWVRTTEWHVRELDTGHDGEQGTGQMVAAASAAGSIGQAARLLLGERDQFAHGVGGG